MPAVVRHSLVLAQRSLIKTRRTPEALIDVTLQPAIFLVLFTYVFGGAIAAGSQHDYLQFLLPGILGQTIALAGVAIGVNLSEDVSKGVFDRFRSLPVARSAPLIGAVLADVVRYLLIFVVTLGFGFALGFRPSAGAGEILLAGTVAIGFALTLSWASVWVGMLARTPGAVQGILMLILFPLSFGSSTFVATDTMPGWLRTVSENNPLTHLVDTERALLLGRPMGDHLWWTLGWMVALVAVFFPLALRAYRRKA
ncbi:MAG: ABC transporter permease [Patulibacter minatonensis]